MFLSLIGNLFCNEIRKILVYEIRLKIIIITVSCSSAGRASGILRRRILVRDKIWEENLSAFFNDLTPVHSAVNEYIVGVLTNDGMNIRHRDRPSQPAIDSRLIKLCYGQKIIKRTLNRGLLIKSSIEKMFLDILIEMRIEIICKISMI